MQRNYTAEDVKRYRDEHSCSVFEAKGHFEKKGILKLVKTANGFETKRCEDGRQQDQMVVYYMNGTLLADQTFDNIRERAAL